MPDQAKSLDAGAGSGKEKFSSGDFKAVLSEAQALTAKAKISPVAAQRRQNCQDWQD
jgi:hypothetical protein